jgi:hypothetical protein
MFRHEPPDLGRVRPLGGTLEPDREGHLRISDKREGRAPARAESVLELRAKTGHCDRSPTKAPHCDDCKGHLWLRDERRTGRLPPLWAGRLQAQALKRAGTPSLLGSLDEPCEQPVARRPPGSAPSSSSGCPHRSSGSHRRECGPPRLLAVRGARPFADSGRTSAPGRD